MRTTLNLNENIINELMRLTGAKNRSQAVNEVLRPMFEKSRCKNS